jgi:hypothetical protein
LADSFDIKGLRLKKFGIPFFRMTALLSVEIGGRGRKPTFSKSSTNFDFQKEIICRLDYGLPARGS